MVDLTSSEIAEALAHIVGAEFVLAKVSDRLAAVSRWSPAAAKADAPGAGAPALVVKPADTEAASDVVRWANGAGVRLAAVGGASNTVLATPTTGIWVAIDVSRLQEIDWDEESLLVHAGAGWKLGDLERTLNGHDYTLGQFPLSLDSITVGGAIATDVAGMLAGKYGRFSDVTLGMTTVLPTGAVVQTRASPLGSAGCDLHRLLIGAEGQLGVTTRATLRMRPAPEARAWAVFTLATFNDGIDALRLVMRSDAAPSGVTLLDFGATSDLGAVAATALPARGAMLLLCFEGDELVQTGHYQIAHAICAHLGGKAQDSTWGDRYMDNRRGAPGTDWAANGRTSGVADVLSVSAAWRNIKDVHAAMRTAAAPLVDQVTIRVGWADTNGAALDVGFTAEAADSATALQLHTRILDGALSACLDQGGSVVHHGGIGAARRLSFERERGSEAVAAWGAIRTALDPNGVFRAGVVLSHAAY